MSNSVGKGKSTLRILLSEGVLTHSSVRSRGKQLEDLANSVERRKAIETKAVSLVNRLHEAMKDVEGMMLVGYKGRQDEAWSLINMGSGQRV